MYQEYRKSLAGLVKAIANENGLEEENQVLIMHLLDSEEKIFRFNEWLESRLVGEKLQATEAEICRAAVQAAKENIQDEPKSAKTLNYTAHVMERGDRAAERVLDRAIAEARAEKQKTAKTPNYTAHTLARGEQVVDRYLDNWLERLSKEDK